MTIELQIVPSTTIANVFTAMKNNANLYFVVLVKFHVQLGQSN